MRVTPLTALDLIGIRRSLDEFKPERIGHDPEAMLLYAEDFATTTRQLLAEVVRLRADQCVPSTPQPYTLFGHPDREQQEA